MDCTPYIGCRRSSLMYEVRERALLHLEHERWRVYETNRHLQTLSKYGLTHLHLQLQLHGGDGISDPALAFAALPPAFDDLEPPRGISKPVTSQLRSLIYRSSKDCRLRILAERSS